MRQGMGKKKRLFSYMIALVWILSIAGEVQAQTTGKISGRVINRTSKSPLIGANVIVTAKWVGDQERSMAEKMGAVADISGDYFIINIPPGLYTISFQMIGYEKMIVQRVPVSVNRTTYLGGALAETVLAGGEVIVKADRMAIKKDQTSSIRNVSANDIDILPVESMGAIVAMQPGVVQGHFRGGRNDEVSYMIDGMQVNDAFFHTSQTVTIEKEAIADLEVITGTFNAEYGQAMSGIVNAVTKEGSDQVEGSISASAGNYYTTHKDVFIGLKDSELARNRDFKAFLSGPIFKGRLKFMTNVRYQDNKNHLNGIHRFNVSDYSDFTSFSPSEWYTEHTGDNSVVPMNWNRNFSVLGKLSWKPFNSVKSSLLYTLNDDESKGYSHSYKYNPSGLPTNYQQTEMYKLQLNHTLSRSAFYEVQLSHVDDYLGNYVYKNPLDARYVHDGYSRSQGPGFATGGQSNGHTVRTLRDMNIKFDFMWQLHRSHSVKAGLFYLRHNLDNQQTQIVNKYRSKEEENLSYRDPATGKYTFLYYEPEILPDSSTYSDIYKAQPSEFSWYIQDKMEFDEMVINFGLRYDLFDPNTVYPSQLRNPANQLAFPDMPENMSRYLPASAKHQLSPRLGLSYQLGDKALLRFSYGHFMQMPPLYYIYQNHSFLIPPSDFSVTTGNPQLNAQKTIQYEVGLWQELSRGMNLEVAVFYRDIYDLLSARVITTFNQIRYGIFSNKDYGNVRGLEVKYEFMQGALSAFLNYTFQYTRGNADNPTFTFTRAGNSQDPVNRLIPMNWDQRHTFNVSAGYNTRRYGATSTLYFNSGTPFTWSPIDQSTLSRINLFPNNASKPMQISLDLSAYYNIFTSKDLNARLVLLAYNILDRLNDVDVNSQTGTAYSAIIREVNKISHRSDFNDYYDGIHDPSMYASPRYVKIGMEFNF
jgi:outer membrane receptor protein involved in Fe transport